MVGIIFKEQISKEESMTDWSLKLTPKQMMYAALDAEFTRRLYIHIKDLPLDP